MACGADRDQVLPSDVMLVAPVAWSPICIGCSDMVHLQKLGRLAAFLAYPTSKALDNPAGPLKASRIFGEVIGPLSESCAGAHHSLPPGFYAALVFSPPIEIILTLMPTAHNGKALITDPLL